MKIGLLLVLASMVLLAVNVGAQEKGGDDTQKLAGKWAATSATNDGKPITDETVKKLRLTLTKDGYKTELGEQVLFDSTFKIDAGQQPKQIDMIGTEGENKGRAAQGIYLLEGETLTLCYTMPGGDRPNTFESKPGSGATLVVWKRLATESGSR
jgi:uncharacterized protein (TIGR03067 family)